MTEQFRHSCNEKRKVKPRQATVPPFFGQSSHVYVQDTINNVRVGNVPKDEPTSNTKIGHFSFDACHFPSQDVTAQTETKKREREIHKTR